MVTKTMNGKNETATPADLSAQIETLRADLGNLTQTIAGIGKAKGEEAADMTKAQLAKVQAAATDQAEAARKHAVEMQGHANEFIRNQPAAAMGIAAGVGFLVGFMGSRK